MDKIDDIDKYIVDSINDINVKLETLDKRISDLEKINKPVLKNYEGGKYFYQVQDYGIPFEDYLIFDKNYEHIPINSKINITFGSNFASYEKLPIDVVFRFKILDDNNIIYSQDKNISISDNGNLSFDLEFDIDKEIKNLSIQFYILKIYLFYFMPNKIFLAGYFFKNNELYLNFL